MVVEDIVYRWWGRRIFWRDFLSIFRSFDLIPIDDKHLQQEMLCPGFHLDHSRQSPIKKVTVAGPRLCSSVCMQRKGCGKALAHLWDSCDPQSPRAKEGSRNWNVAKGCCEQTPSETKYKHTKIIIVTLHCATINVQLVIWLIQTDTWTIWWG